MVCWYLALMKNDLPLEQYLYGDAFNVEIYEILTEQSGYKGLFEPKAYFDSLYDEFDFFDKNKDNYLAIKTRYNGLKMEGLKRYFFLLTLQNLIIKTYPTGLRNEFLEFSDVAEKSFDIIKKLVEEIQKELFPEEDIKPADQLDDLSALNVDKENIDQNSIIQQQGYTNSQLTLIFYYFFKGNGMEVRKDINIAPVAKFMHLITGKEFTATTNSEFYKKLQKAPNFKSDKELIKDLEVIKPLFEGVQLNDIVKLIDDEIAIAKRENKKTP